VDLCQEVWYLQFFWGKNFSAAKDTFEKRLVLPTQPAQWNLFFCLFHRG